MKRLAIFDFDGTLFNSIDDVVICFNKALTVHDFPTLTRDEYIPCLGGNIDDIVSKVLGDNGNTETVKKTYLDFYNASEKEMTVPFPHTRELLERLIEKDILLAINSNRLTYSLNEFVKKYFSDIDFVGIEGHSYPNPSKPDPYGVNRIIKRANIKKEDAIYIGDSSTDIRTSENAGVDCIIVKWGYGNADDYADAYISGTVESPSEILKYF